jgi:hypothetical protein
VGNAAMGPGIPRRVEPEGGYEIDIGQTVGNGADKEGLFPQFATSHDLADGSAEYDMGHRIHVLKVDKKRLRSIQCGDALYVRGLLLMKVKDDDLVPAFL